MAFIHLHNHSDFSLLDGASRVDRMVELTAKQGMGALALTDHGNMFGAVTFFEQCKKKGIKPIIGCETYVAFGRHDEKEPGSRGSRSNHLVLLVENEQGYKNLVKLVTKAYLDGFYYRPRIDKELLRAHHEGLIGLSACLNGPICGPLMAGDPSLARQNAAEFQEIFGKDSFFVEIQDHGLPEQDQVRPELFEIARELSIPAVGTNDCHYLGPGDHQAHDVLLCIGTGKSRLDGNRLKYNVPEFYIKSEKDMRRRPAFAANGDLLDLSAAIADRVQFDLPRGKSYLPNFPLPPGFTLEEYFIKVVQDGWAPRRAALEVRAGKGKLRHPLADYEARLASEIDMIRMMKFPGYFLVVWDLIREARGKGIPVGPGRGSAAGSLVAYSLGITDVDPLEYDLLFERFLNPERITMPDIDIDFCMRRRDEVIRYVTDKYGRENVCQIITFNRMKARAVVRDVGRTLDMSYGEVDRIAKMIPPAINQTLDDALKEVPQLKAAYDADARVKDVLDIGRSLEGLSRQAGVHAAGVVIAPAPLTEFLPLYRSTNDEITTQYAKDEVEKVGLLKMDFLGLRTLTVVYDAVALMAADGIAFDLEHLELDDEATYKLFQDGRCNGVFQFESTGMKDILRRFRPTVFEDLVALNALYRPGSIKGGMIDEFIKCHAGRGKVEYLLPELEEILKETYGVIVYQEQVMRIASVVAGFTLGQADTLRKAMGKKQLDLMAAQRKAFVDGARARKVSESKARHIFDLIEKFAEYGFNKAHSAAYALIAYQTAYLKTHYPVHFMAALLTSEKGDTDKVVKYIGECRDMGIKVLPPDVNRSALDFAVAGNEIRFGLGAIKNVGEGAIESILGARQRVGSFRTLRQLVDEVDLRAVNRRVLESLVKSGCFDSLGAKRSALMAMLDRTLEGAQSRRADAESGQVSLFASLMDEGADEPPPPDIPELPESELLAQEKQMLGFYLSGHPLLDYRKVLEEHANADTGRIREGLVAGEVSLGVIVTSSRPVKTRKGDWMKQLTLEDLQGTIEATAFPEATKKYGDLLTADRPVLVRGRVEADEDKAKLLVSEVLPLDEVAERTARRLFILIQDDGPDLAALRRFREEIERRFHGEACEVHFDCRLAGGVRALVRPSSFLRVKPSRELTALCEEIVGKGTVRYAT
ncbi:MAG: DNA polymerase III subunit alpha [Acidobacteriota bacterium]